MPSGRRRPRAVGAELVEDLSLESPPLEGFSQRHRHRIRTILEDGTKTEPYVADFVDRRGSIRDAVVVLPFEASDPIRVLLRRQFRYAAYVAHGVSFPIEAIAGLIDDDEPYEQTVVRELHEEANIRVSFSQIRTLGEPWFSTPGLLTERVIPFAVQVPPGTFERACEAEAPGDGSPFEAGAELLAVDLDEALEWNDRPMSPNIDEVWLADAKTEIVLWRLRRRLERARG